MSTHSNSDDDDWFSLESKPAEPPKPKPPAAPKSKGSEDAPKSSFDDDLPDLAPMNQPPPAPQNRRAEQALRDALGAQEDLLDESRADTKPPAKEPKPKLSDREYSISCKVCKTLIMVRPSKVGTQVRCPDCHSMLVVPPPPVKKPVAQATVDELDGSVQLSPVENDNPRSGSGASVNTKEILSKASKELQREREEIESVSGAFDSKEWLSRTVGFLSDLRLVIALSILSLIFSVAFYFQALIPSNPEEGLMASLERFREDLLFALTVPIQWVLFICAVAVVPKAANREKRIEPWPFFQNIKEYAGPALVGFAAFLLTNFVANLLMGGLAVIKVPVFLRDLFAEILQWGILPIAYLSMLELRSYIKPFSMSIFKSISAKSDAWGAMYMQTGVAWVLYFVLWQVSRVSTPSTSVYAGFVFPWFICFVANQYGVLAGRISDVTELGYEGVFTDNE